MGICSSCVKGRKMDEVERKVRQKKKEFEAELKARDEKRKLEEEVKTRQNKLQKLEDEIKDRWKKLGDKSCVIPRTLLATDGFPSYDSS